MLMMSNEMMKFINGVKPNDVDDVWPVGSWQEIFIFLINHL